MRAKALFATAKKSSAKLQSLLDITKETASHENAFTVLQHDDVLALEHRLELPDAIKIHERTSTDAKKILRVKLRFESVQRFTQDMAFFADIDSDVVTGGFDGIDVCDFKNHDLVIGLYGEAS